MTDEQLAAVREVGRKIARLLQDEGPMDLVNYEMNDKQTELSFCGDIRSSSGTLVCVEVEISEHFTFKEE